MSEELYRKALDTYGVTGQMRQLQEECGELIVAVSHFLRDCTNTNKLSYLIEELVDVEIMIGQLKLILDQKAFEVMKKKKHERLLERIEELKAPAGEA